jgi:hypothetical protein
MAVPERALGKFMSGRLVPDRSKQGVPDLIVCASRPDYFSKISLRIT